MNSRLKRRQVGLRRLGFLSPRRRTSRPCCRGFNRPDGGWPTRTPRQEVRTMFRSFTIKNFRCFRDLTISSLERVNLIGGKNNVGKTALLEAIFLHVGPNSPQLPWVLNAHRGIEQ